ncbi:hypothetical protein LEL_03770 [Akanthomyces lecanii RCEF 1005]|uniref:Uncharacterized protein n=1 Tax=Akanthomyces lecanii RCEF 1005 TaxID=1081108 RepID=A0A168JD12_CORDF|nr:hypothetical protein LEL_03770 [Akanthomyces lecanii RCEF 1005]
MSLSIDLREPRLARLYKLSESLAEYTTAKLWFYIFFEFAFRGGELPVNIDFLTWGRRKRIKSRNEIVVRRCIATHGTTSKETILLWVCAPCAREPEFDIEDLELLANITASRYILQARETLQTVWIMTSLGPYARLWAYTTEDDRSGHHLWPIFPLGEHGAKVSYLPLRGHEAHFQFLFDLVQRDPNPTADLVRSIARGTAEDQLVDVRNTTQVSPQGRRGSVLDCRLPDGSIVGISADWHRAYIIWENQPWECHQCCFGGESASRVRYWTWWLIPGTGKGQD